MQSADAIHRTMAWHTNANNQGLVIEHTIALIIPSLLLEAKIWGIISAEVQYTGTRYQVMSLARAEAHYPGTG